MERTVLTTRTVKICGCGCGLGCGRTASCGKKCAIYVYLLPAAKERTTSDGDDGDLHVRRNVTLTTLLGAKRADERNPGRHRCYTST